MQEFVPTEAMPPRGNCPSAEDLAAYIDGMVDEAEGQRITEHLASCRDCYEVYAGVLRFQLDSETGETESENVVQFPVKGEERHRRPWWLAVAAALLLAALGTATYYALLAPPPAMVTAQVVEPLQGKPGLADGFWLGPTTRGTAGSEVESDPASFQMGVQLVNLHWSLKENQGETATDIVARILQVIDASFGQQDPLYQAYAGITASIVDGTPASSLTDRALNLEQEARKAFDIPHLDLGQWVEAGRLAAYAQDPSFLQSRESRQFLRRLLWRQRFGIGEMRVDPVALSSLKEIAEVLDGRDLGSSDYDALIESFDEILSFYYPE